MRRYEIADEQWYKIKPYFENKKYGKWHNMDIVEQHRNLHARYGTWNALYKYFLKSFF